MGRDGGGRRRTGPEGPPRRRAVGGAMLVVLVAVTAVWFGVGVSSGATPAPSPRAGAPTTQDAAKVCAEASDALTAGEIDFAVGLFGTGVGAVASDPCVGRVLKTAAQQRQYAREEAARGQQALLNGNLVSADSHFHGALAADSADSVAQQGLSQVAKLRTSDSSPAFDWDTFYADRVEPAYRLIGAFAVVAVLLFMLSALASRWLVGVGARAWPTGHRRFARYLGSLLIAGSAAFLPLYTMFSPFTANDVVPGWSIGVVLGVTALFAFVWWLAYLARASEVPEGKQAKWRLRRYWKDWWPPLAAIGVVLVPAGILWYFGLSTPYHRLLITYAVLILLAVIITATAYGQNSRLQVVAMGTDGTVDEASTDYLLTRLQTLGMERTRGLTLAGIAAPSGGSPSAMSSLQSSDLSGLPSGAIAGTIAKIVFALRPDLTWRAQVTLVDENRVAMRLSRNGKLAFTGVFSRSDMSLAPVPQDGPDAKNAADRARAQVLTGAAAFILVQLGVVQPDLSVGLCGATQWKSVALQIIASSVSLAEGENVPALLRMALNLDPANDMARYQYIRGLDTKLNSGPYDQMVLAMYRDLKHRLEDPKARAKDPTSEVVKDGWESLYLEILCEASAAALERAVRQPGLAHPVAPAWAFITPLVKNCEHLSEDWTAGPDDGVATTARSILPLAQNFKRIAEQLQHSGTADRGKLYESPLLAYNDACLAALRLRGPHVPTADRERITDVVINDLAFALSTDGTRTMARTDEYLATVRDDRRFIALAGMPQRPTGCARLLEPLKKALGRVPCFGTWLSR